MRREFALRLTELSSVVAMFAAAAGSAFSSSIAVSGHASTSNGGTDPWFELNPIGGLVGAPSATSSHGSLNANAGAIIYEEPFFFGLSATVFGLASDMQRGATATTYVEIRVTDRINPYLPAGYDRNHVYRYIQHMYINGNVGGFANPPGYFESAVGMRVEHNTQIVFSAAESRSSDGPGLGPMPQGDVTFVIETLPEVVYDLRITALASASGDTIEDAGAFQAHSTYFDTFRWGSVSDVFDVTAGVPVPAEDFHLYGEDGFDWAHPPAIVPEPSSFLLVASGLVGLGLMVLRKKHCRG